MLLLFSLEKQIPPLTSELSVALAHMDSTLAQVDTLLSQAEKTIRPNSPLYYQFSQAMLQLKNTAISIEKLSEFVHRNPDALIFGLQNPGKAEHNK